MSKDDEIKGNKDYASVMDKIREKRNVDSRFNLSCDFMDGEPNLQLQALSLMVRNPQN